MYYHGSKSIFKEFDKNRIGQNFTYSKGSGFFFTKSKRRAEGYAGTLDSPGFIFEAELTFNKPARYKTNSELYTPADYFDIHSPDLLREAFLDGSDALFIEGTMGDDVVVVFEPEQVKIRRVFQSDRLVYDHEYPEQTAYPDIMGKDVPSNVNTDTKPFHYDHIEEYLKSTVTSSEFGDRLDDEIGKSLIKKGDCHTDDGRHFGMGEDFRKLALSLFCEGGTGDNDVHLCREDCLVICDFDEDVTMVQDLRGTKDSLGVLALRPMKEVASAVKSFNPGDSDHPSRCMAHIVGPENIVDELLSETPDYMLEFTSVVRTVPQVAVDHREPSKIEQECPLSGKSPSVKL
jgi:hypothetical protein